MLAIFAHILADAIAPYLARWSESREREILQVGEPLPPALLARAHALGIDLPEGLRLEICPKIPLPLPRPVIALARTLGLPVFVPAGMCLGRGLSCLTADPALLHHELVHTLQYQRLQSHKAFMRAYVFECLHHGYHDAPLESEARRLAGETPPS